MKTKIKQWQKRIVMAAIAVVALLFEISAQKSNSAFKAEIYRENLRAFIAEINMTDSQLISLLIAPVKSPSNVYVSRIILNVEEEEHIKVEPWMLDESHFTGNSTFTADIFTEQEESVPVEKWMLDETHFMPEKSISDNPMEEEEDLKVEEWMLDATHFSISDNN